MRMLAAALLCGACAPAPPREPLHNRLAPSPRLVPIEGIAPLPLSLYDGAPRDCRPSQRLRARFAGARVIPCGSLAIAASADARAAARRCVEQALAEHQAFLLEALLQGIDSEVASALLAVVERGELVTYKLFYDSDPCGGGCPDRGLLTIERCGHLRPEPAAIACAHDVTRCFRCEDDEAVELCRFGSP